MVLFGELVKGGSRNEFQKLLEHRRIESHSPHLFVFEWFFGESILLNKEAAGFSISQFVGQQCSCSHYLSSGLSLTAAAINNRAE